VKSRRAQLLEFAVLGLLHEGPTHGYDLRRRLNTALGPFRALSYGTLYPALRDLLDHGLIAETTDPPARAAVAPGSCTN
jgi:DNA-binding PadR family transcriptional regulator